SQCVHTTGTVCTDWLRSTYSKWIIECPLCVSHSAQAWTHAWQPMHRDGSMKNSISPLMRASGGSLLRFEAAGVLALLSLADPHGTDLVLGDLRDRVLRGDRHEVDALLAGPVVGHEDHVGPDGRHHLAADGQPAAARLDRHPVAVGDAVLLRQDRVQFQLRLG